MAREGLHWGVEVHEYDRRDGREGEGKEEVVGRGRGKGRWNR